MSQTEGPKGLSPDCDEHAYYQTCKTMQEFGGHFASRLADAMLYADSTNRRRIIEAFPDLMIKYGPGSIYFEERCREVKRYNPTINAGDLGSSVKEV